MGEDYNDYTGIRLPADYTGAEAWGQDDNYAGLVKLILGAVGNRSLPKEIDAFKACSLVEAMQKILASKNIDECHSIAKEVLSNYE